MLDTAEMDCRHALPSEISDFEDAVMVETAARTEADYIVTQNIRNFSKSPVQVCTPEGFLQKPEDLGEHFQIIIDIAEDGVVS